MNVEMPADENGKLEVRRKRALYRAAHRGTKEMDILLSKFANARVSEMTRAELSEFEDLLALPDPQLQTWLVTLDAPVEEGVPRLIGVVRAFHGLD